ncbi:MAG: DUF4180 domain-containing protein [Candidatus Pristimantibacillus lignocellulolyticus]|uniref:DUF4180 domain-containing protein n=1 Tax=Candidatus Pristimantibacillus lignocellulolyticus TaxID=2994561 RepID=A0A9J6ZBT7_9BACL|nr:MAG: DUF4180 domain-containing protein [Candidatus Pristimantibacillus lignocellulolyticus]
MNIIIDQIGNSKVAMVDSTDIIIHVVQDALDLMASISYNNNGCNKIMIYKSNITEDFFDLKTRIAGDVLQKYANYNVKLAIIGDFDEYNSKSLKDFIYECNNGKQVFFLKDKQDALYALHSIN